MKHPKLFLTRRPRPAPNATHAARARPRMTLRRRRQQWMDARTCPPSTAIARRQSHRRSLPRSVTAATSSHRGSALSATASSTRRTGATKRATRRLPNSSSTVSGSGFSRQSAATQLAASAPNLKRKQGLPSVASTIRRSSRRDKRQPQPLEQYPRTAPRLSPSTSGAEPCLTNTRSRAPVRPGRRASRNRTSASPNRRATNASRSAEG